MLSDRRLICCNIIVAVQLFYGIVQQQESETESETEIACSNPVGHPHTHTALEVETIILESNQPTNKQTQNKFDHVSRTVPF